MERDALRAQNAALIEFIVRYYTRSSYTLNLPFEISGVDHNNVTLTAGQPRANDDRPGDNSGSSNGDSSTLARSGSSNNPSINDDSRESCNLAVVAASPNFSRKKRSSEEPVVAEATKKVKRNSSFS